MIISGKLILWFAFNQEFLTQHLPWRAVPGRREVAKEKALILSVLAALR